jgi:hypothetical protein
LPTCAAGASESVLFSFTKFASTDVGVLERWVAAEKRAYPFAVKAEPDQAPPAALSAQTERRVWACRSQMRTSAADALVSFQLIDDRNLLLLFYATGRLEFRYPDSLTICATVDACLFDVTATSPSSPAVGSRTLDMALSPNGVCACVIGSCGDLHLLHVGRALVPQHIYEDLSALSLHVVDVLELAIVNSRDCWDCVHWVYGLLELHRRDGNDSGKVGRLLDRIMLNFSNNFAMLDVNFRRAYRHSVEALKSLIFRNIPSQARHRFLLSCNWSPCHACCGALMLTPPTCEHFYAHLRLAACASACVCVRACACTRGSCARRR